MSDRAKQTSRRARATDHERESEYAESGVDRTLIRWMLSLTPTERLLVIQEQVNAIQAMKEQIDSH